MIRRLLFVLPLGGCLLDLPTPTINDDAGFDGSTPDTYVPGDGNMPDGMMMMGDAGMDGTSTLDGSGGCDGGPCLFAMLNNTPRLLDNANNTIYLAVGTSEIDAIPIANPSPTPVLPNTPADFVQSLRVRNGYVYFTSYGNGNHSVSRCAVAGCNQRIDYSTANYKFSGVDADSSNVYFTIDDTAGTNKGGVWSCGNGGACGGFMGLSFGSAHGLAADNMALTWFVSAGSGAAYVCSVPFCGALSSPIGNGIVDITSDGTRTWLSDGSTISYFPKGNPNGIMTFVSSGGGAANTRTLRSDGTAIYWLTKDAMKNGYLRKCKIQGQDCMNGSATTLASNINDPVDLTVTGSEVFYSTVPNNSVWRVAK